MIVMLSAMQLDLHPTQCMETIRTISLVCNFSCLMVERITREQVAGQSFTTESMKSKTWSAQRSRERNCCLTSSPKLELSVNCVRFVSRWMFVHESLLIRAGSVVPRIVCELDGFTMNDLGYFRKKQGLRKWHSNSRAVSVLVMRYYTENMR